MHTPGHVLYQLSDHQAKVVQRLLLHPSARYRSRGHNLSARQYHVLLHDPGTLDVVAGLEHACL